MMQRRKWKEGTTGYDITNCTIYDCAKGGFMLWVVAQKSRGTPLLRSYMNSCHDLLIPSCLNCQIVRSINEF